MKPTLVELFKHNKWANLRLIDACAQLNDDQLDASIEGTYGRVRDTLLHLLAAEERYVSLLTGETPAEPIHERMDFPGLAVLRQRAERSGDHLIQVAAKDPYKEILHPTRGGQTYDLPAVIPLIQAIHHANDHRTHIVTTLSQHGIEPPDLSAWTYGEIA